MAAPVTTTTDTDFAALTTLEQQIVYLIALAVSKQNVYNAANLTSQQNRVAISPSFSTNSLTLQAQFAISNEASIETLTEAVTSFLP